MKNKRDLLFRRESHNSVSNSGNSVLPFISGMGLGAGIMYVLDPDRGNRRRAMAQQKLFRVAHLGGKALDKAVRDLEHRAEGLFYETAHLVRREPVADDILERRVRAKLGRVACHPGSIEVRASNGHVVLGGPVLRGESEEIVRAVRHVRGVRDVESHFEEHEASEQIPGLQGQAQRPGDKPELLQENWAPGTRLIMGGLGLALVARAIRKPGLLTTVTGALGVALLARSGRRTRVVDTLMDSIKPAPGARAGRRQSAAAPANPGARSTNQGRRDAVGKSGVYPATSQTEAVRSVDLQTLLRPREIPRDQWLKFFSELDKGLDWPPVTIEVQEGGQTHVEQREMPFDGIGADLKDRENIITVGVGRRAEDLVIHTIAAKRVAIRDSGDNKLLEIEGNDGTITVVRFRSADLHPKRVVA